ncbi:MAG: hypothetical protein ACFFD1_09935 [Candidatus Thorarchaeota archaeon]
MKKELTFGGKRLYRHGAYTRLVWRNADKYSRTLFWFFILLAILSPIVGEIVLQNVYLTVFFFILWILSIFLQLWYAGTPRKQDVLFKARRNRRNLKRKLESRAEIPTLLTLW